MTVIRILGELLILGLGCLGLFAILLRVLTFLGVIK
jgi:hypothetical protein